MDSICYSCKGIVQNHAYVGKKKAPYVSSFTLPVYACYTLFLITMKCCIFFNTFCASSA